MTDFAALKSALRAGTVEGLQDTPFADAPCERLRLALQVGSGAGPADLAVLVRQVLRHEGRHGGIAQISLRPCSHPWSPAAAWKSHGCRVREGDGFLAVEADDWSPVWLRRLHRSALAVALGDERGVFYAAEQAEVRHPRLSLAQRIPTDPALLDLVENYLSPAQAETIRSVMLSPAGCVRLVVLPTGSGKSLVGLSAALAGPAKAAGLTIIVVPTIALAFDQMAQARQHSQASATAIDAWRSGLDSSLAAAIRERIRNGQQRILYVSPESLVGALRKDIEEATSRGFLSAFVIDEAHLVTQWGASFRPEFQTLTALWRQLRSTCPEGRIFKTLLMTATVTAETHSDLRRLFHTDDGVDLITLAAVHLRPEPDYFMARCQTDEEREERLLEILRHAPRPAILYVTKVADAIRWHRWCINRGWHRTGMVHGDCPAPERESAIIKWRNCESDLMVATSAFGVGMDKGDVRLVIHACVPETLDRFYQEVGRGGRDGRACVSILLPTDDDLRTGQGMSAPNLIGDELGLERWRTLWYGRQTLNDLHRLDLRALRPGKQWDSERNIGWNIRTLLMLARAGVIELVDTGTDYSEPGEAAPPVHATVRRLGNSPLSEDAWDQQVGRYRQEAVDAARRNWSSMEQILNCSRPLVGVLQQTYRVPEAYIHDVPEIPGYEAPFPPADLRCSLSPALRRISVVHASGTILVTYRTTGASRDELCRRITDSLTLLCAAGIREISLPAAWRTRNSWGGERNPIVQMQASVPEKFLIVRDPSEDQFFAKHPQVPRVSFIPPELSEEAPYDQLFLVERPLHLILLPEECPAPGHPQRRIGDGVFPAIYLLDLLRHLKS